MPRPENEIIWDGPVVHLARAAQLREQAGPQPYRKLADATHYSASVLADARHRCPTLAVIKGVRRGLRRGPGAVAAGLGRAHNAGSPDPALAIRYTRVFHRRPLPSGPAAVGPRHRGLAQVRVQADGVAVRSPAGSARACACSRCGAGDDPQRWRPSGRRSTLAFKLRVIAWREPGPGFGRRLELGHHWGREAVHRQAARLRPSIPPRTPPRCYALELGRSHWGRQLWAGLEAIPLYERTSPTTNVSSAPATQIRGLSARTSQKLNNTVRPVPAADSIAFDPVRTGIRAHNEQTG
jgi:hypothetical protein